MPSYSYVARTSQGTLEQGSVDASSIDRARAILHDRGLTIEELEGDSTAAFAETPIWTATDEPSSKMKNISKADVAPSYIPLTQTLRLFAGWLMAWYGIIFLAGTYRADGRLPWDVPAIQGLSQSPLVLRFAFAVFLFLLLTDVQKWTKGGSLKAIVLSIAGVIVFILFHLNV